mgnify:FL=1
MKKKEKTVEMTITAIFIALLLIQTFVPDIGYIRIIPALPAITTIPLTIAIYGSLMGPKMGASFGLFWGLTRMVVAYTQPGDMVSLLLFRNPVISILPSVLAGWLVGLITSKIGHKKAGYVFGGAVASLINTIMVILLATLFFMHNPTSLTSFMGHFSQGTPLFVILVLSLGLNGLVEAIFTAVAVPFIMIPLNYIKKRAM